MEQITTLKQAWIFDPKGNLKQSKTQKQKQNAKQVYQIAKQALAYSKALNPKQFLKRISFVNGKEEWTITITHTEQIIVMHKEQE